MEAQTPKKSDDSKQRPNKKHENSCKSGKVRTWVNWIRNWKLMAKETELQADIAEHKLRLVRAQLQTLLILFKVKKTP